MKVNALSLNKCLGYSESETLWRSEYTESVQWAQGSGFNLKPTDKIKVKEIPIYFTRLQRSGRKHCVHEHFPAWKAGCSSLKYSFIRAFIIVRLFFSWKKSKLLKVVLNFHLQTTHWSGLLFWKKEAIHVPIPALLSSILFLKWP